MNIKIDRQKRCAVIGHGSWATALVTVLVQNGVKVEWYVRNAEVLESLVESGSNSRYLSDVEFDKEMILPSNDIDSVVAAADIVILAMPSAFLKSFLEPLTVSLRDKIVVSAVKGIISPDYKTVAEYIHSEYDLPYRQIGLLSGPSHAEEVSRGKLSYLTSVCSDNSVAHLVGAMFECNSLRVSYSEDLYGVEYAAILKNIYALAVGVSVGLGYGDNFVSVLISNCADELSHFLDSSYPAQRNTQASAYLGDLLVTCYSTYSRNRRLGLLVGNGHTVKSALNEMTMVAEGYYAADCMHHIAKSKGIEMPIVEMVYSILYERASAKRAMQALTHKLV